MKSKNIIARELLAQINRLTCRWHLGFTEIERKVVREALEKYAATRPRRTLALPSQDRGAAR